MKPTVHRMTRAVQRCVGRVAACRPPGRGRVCCLLPLLSLSLGPVIASPADNPVTPGASPEVCSLLAFLSDVYGKKTLSGQQQGWRGTNALGYELAHIRDVTSELPAILSQDFIDATWKRSSPDRRGASEVVANAVDWYTRSNGIVAFCWHWFAPTAERSFYTKETSFDLTRGVTEGTPEHAALLGDLDTVAGELATLRDAGVPVLWRPMHEMNGRWFWWGARGPEPFKQLWKLMFARFTGAHSLTNLVWVFSPGAATDLADWYPGDAYVDLIGQDHYPMDGNHGPAGDAFMDLVDLTGGAKMIGMSENGPIPDPGRMESEHAEWLFFITWAGKMLEEQNPDAHLKTVYQHPRVMNLDDLPPLRGYPFKPTGVAEKLGFPAAPSTVAVRGLRSRPVVVAVQDADGQTLRTGRFRVSLAVGSNPAQAVLGGTVSVDTINGVAAFSDLTLDQAGEGYTLVASASGLRDAVSRPFAVGPGSGIVREWWDEAGAGMAGDFPASAGRELLTKALEYPVTPVSNYTARYRALLMPPLDGVYTFWLANAGISELWLGTGDPPSGKQKIGEVTPGTPYQKWPHVSEAATAPVELKADKRYYFEMIHHQPLGSAQLAVRWQLPDGTRESPVPGCRFEPLQQAEAGGESRHHTPTDP